MKCDQGRGGWNIPCQKSRSSICGVLGPKNSLRNYGICIQITHRNKHANLGWGWLSEHKYSTPFSLREKKERERGISLTIWHFPLQRGCVKQIFSYSFKWTHICFALLERIWECDAIGQMDIHTYSKLYFQKKSPILTILASPILKENIKSWAKQILILKGRQSFYHELKFSLNRTRWAF